MSVYLGLLTALPTETTPAIEPRDEPGYARQQVTLRLCREEVDGRGRHWYLYENASEVRFALASRPWPRIVGVGIFGADRALRKAASLIWPIDVPPGHQPYFEPGQVALTLSDDELALLDGADLLTDEVSH